jgi:aspartate kinase
MIVMKFGGSSVEDAAAIRRLVSIVRRQSHRQPVVVVSAMGKTTDGLLECARLAAAGGARQAQNRLDEIAGRHFKTAEQLAPQQEIESLREALGKRFIAIRSTLEEINQTGGLTPRLSDAVSSNGELLSSLIVAAALRADGIKGVWVDVRPMMRTNGDFTRAAPQFEIANPKLKEGLMAALASGGAPVTQDFIGSTADGVTTTIGRGGADYSASIIGAALDAEEIQIWTDVDGVMSTLLPAMAGRIPARVCNSRRPEAAGASFVRSAPPSHDIIKAIAFKRGITVINVTSDRMLMAHGFLSRLFAVFDRHETSIDMVVTSEVSVAMTLDDTRRLDAIVADMQSLGKVSVERDAALIRLVGENLKFTPGVASRIFSSIEKINVSVISHGASAVNVSFIVDGASAEQAIRSLHSEFFSELDEETFEAAALAQTVD